VVFVYELVPLTPSVQDADIYNKGAAQYVTRRKCSRWAWLIRGTAECKLVSDSGECILNVVLGALVINKGQMA
jgi:hypothetical protein